MSDAGMQNQGIREALIPKPLWPTAEAAMHVQCQGVEEPDDQQRMERSSGNSQSRVCWRRPCTQDRTRGNRSSPEHE